MKYVNYGFNLSQSGFIMAETIVALAVLVAGISLGLGVETVMSRHERRQTEQVRQARATYEQARLAQFNLQPLGENA